MPLNHRPHSAESVVIIGGGIIGALCAYQLARRGRQVTIVEKGSFGRGSSWGNCGIILPSHLFPLNSPENLVRGLRWLLKKDAPLWIRPRPDPALFSWLAGFALRCTPTARHRSARAIAALLDGAADRYDALIAAEHIFCEWQRSGAIQLFRSVEAFRARAATDAEGRRYGRGCTRLSKGELMRLEPGAGPWLAGAWMDEAAAHLKPESLMIGLRRVLKERGVSIFEDTRFLYFHRRNGKAETAVTSRGNIAADAFVVAGGAWTPLLADALGVRLPIQPGKGYSVTLVDSGRTLNRPCFFEEARSVATPWPGGLRLGGTMEFSGYDDRLDPIRIRALFAAARGYLGIRHLGRVEEEWCGWRPMTVDGVPVIDRLPEMKNVVVAAGHNMLGIAMAPATGRLVAEMLTGEAPHIDPAPYRLGRFGRLVK